MIRSSLLRSIIPVVPPRSVFLRIRWKKKTLRSSGRSGGADGWQPCPRLDDGYEDPEGRLLRLEPLVHRCAGHPERQFKPKALRRSRPGATSGQPPVPAQGTILE